MTQEMVCVGSVTSQSHEVQIPFSQTTPPLIDFIIDWTEGGSCGTNST